MWTLLLNKYVAGGIAVLLLLASIGVSLLVWKHSIEVAATLQFNQKQLEQVIADQKQLSTTLDKINGIQQKISDELAAKNQALDDKLVGIETYLTSPEAKKSDRTSSDLLKKTMEELRK